MYFAESYWNAAGARTFNVLINGKQVLTNFDIYATVGGQNKATVQYFSTTANSSGQIVIQFTTGTVDNPQINAIAVIDSGSSTTTLPAAPTSLTATTASSSSITLSWTASTTSGVTYSVYRSTTSGFAPSSSTLIASGLSTTSYSDTGLAASTTYYYVVAAVNSNGSASSSQTSATTSATTTTSSVYINCGGSATGSYVADAYYSGGSTASTTSAIDTSLLNVIPPQAALQTNRWGACTYTVTGLTAGSNYTVGLYFAESYWNAAGARKFRFFA